MKVTNFNYWELSKFNKWILKTPIVKRIVSDRHELMVIMHGVKFRAEALKECILENNWLDGVDEDIIECILMELNEIEKLSTIE